MIMIIMAIEMKVINIPFARMCGFILEKKLDERRYANYAYED